MTAPPAFASVQEYSSRLCDAGFWWPYVAEIMERHDLAGARRELYCNDRGSEFWRWCCRERNVTILLRGPELSIRREGDPMYVERSIEIPAPRDLVWRLVHDPATRAQWDVRVAELTLHGEQVPGTQATITWRTPIATCVSEAEVTSFDIPNRSAMAIDEASLPIFPPGERIFLFEQTRKGTRVSTRYEIDTDAEHRAPGFLVRLVMGRDAKRSLNNLRRLAVTAMATHGAPVPQRDRIIEGA